MFAKMFVLTAFLAGGVLFLTVSTTPAQAADRPLAIVPADLTAAAADQNAAKVVNVDRYYYRDGQPYVWRHNHRYYYYGGPNRYYYGGTPWYYYRGRGYYYTPGPYYYQPDRYYYYPSPNQFYFGWGW